MKSIRMKMFALFSLFLIFFVLLSLLMNFNFLEDYYIYRNKGIFYENYELIKEKYEEAPEEIENYLVFLDRSEGINALIISKDLVVKYASFYRRNHSSNEANRNPLSKKIISYIRSDFNSENESSNFYNEYFYDIIEDPQYDFKYLQFLGRLNENEYLVLGKPISTVHLSSKISNEFFIITGILTIILGNIFIFFFSKRMTKPIVELSKIAKNIANLDFTKKFNITSQDEIGVLGESINQISDELDKVIKKLVEANEKLKEDIERKKQIDNMRKVFISSVSHELKTPIGLIKGYAEGLKYNIANNQEKKNHYCDVIIDETDKMSKLVKDLLDLSHLESGVFKIEKTTFDISALVSEVVDKYRTILDEKGINFQIENENTHFVEADYTRIEQVVINYLINAIKHVDHRKIINITVKEIDDKVRVSVFNTGKQIPEDEIENIWTIFYKLDKAHSRDYGSSGIGLSIVKTILELNNGSYGVINRENGVEFWFELKKVAHN